VAALLLGFGVGYGQGVREDGKAKLLVFGDVNLGRAVGQRLIRGNLGYPFELVIDTLRKADIVFVNLESQLSNQHGVTEHPKYNMIFTGPPTGAVTLKQANISVVSTANNHAFDYGIRALRETIENLRDAGVRWVGTSTDSVGESKPAIIECGNIKIGFLAYTQFVNSQGSWGGRIALFEKDRARRDIEALKLSVDMVVVSYHAGAEYVDAPPAKLRQEFRYLVECGADVVLGHHPHYVQGIEWYRGKLVFYSLGNFVFHQPQRNWTRYGLGVEIDLVKDTTVAGITNVALRVVRSGLQPSFEVTELEESQFFDRLKSLSSARIQRLGGVWAIDQKGNQ
jgi:poly-gamma-glutamate synthesis protein (capsule biosynthesis protein)